MNEWPIVPLQEAFSLRRGHDLPGHQRRAGDVPVISSGGASGFHDVAIADGPGVVLGRATNLGQPTWVEGPYWPHNTTLYVEDFRGNDPRWVFWWFKTHDLSSYNSGSVQPMLNRNYIAKHPVRLPPLAEQERIAGVLGAFDDLIEVNRRLAESIEQTMRLRFSQALQNSTFRTTLAETASFVNGRNFTKDATGFGRPVIRTPEVRLGPSPSTVRNSVAADVDRLARQGDILFVWSGSLTVNRWRHEEGLVNQHVFKVIPRKQPGWYVFGLIESQMPWFVGLAKDKATTMGHIQRAHLEEPMIGLPREVVEELDAVMAPLWSASIQLQVEADDLTLQRDELLPLLMSGKVVVGAEGVPVP